jgi:hypothetical protein
MEHNGACSHKRSTEVGNDTIADTYFILYVDMELLKVGGPLLMTFVLQFSLCLYELQRLLITMYYCLFPQNVLFPLTIGLYNEIHFLFIGGVFLGSIRECLTMVCH